jgi:formate-dependent nitrite reductase membrane component NrfD
MEDPKNKSPRLASTIRWAARTLGILAIAFVSLFALDAFSGGAGLGQKIAAFLLHMIPSFVLIIVLIIAWKHELVGGILMTLIGLAASALVYSLNYGRSHSVSRGLQTAAMIGVPFVIAGLLFVISHFLRRPKTLAGQAQ